MFRSHLPPLLPALCFLLRITTASAAEPLQMRTEGPRFVGSVGCKSSSCHGGAGEKRSQFITWTRQDFHARAYAILTNARSMRMAETLGLSAAQSSSRCTSCHSPLQAAPTARLVSSASPTEGVSCESCHGAAEAWLRGHTRTDWTYATGVGAGMRDLKSFYVRANTCVACHQNLDSDLAAAGHPELIFEMDRQSTDEPKHWRDPEGSSNVRAWLVGQAVVLREVSWKLSHNPAANEDSLAQWNALAWLLNKVTEFDRTLLPIDPPNPDSFARTQQQADALARHASQQNFNSTFADRLLRELIVPNAASEESELPRDLLFRRAQRLVLAIAALTRERGGLVDEIKTLRDDVNSPVDFDPAQFNIHLAALRSHLQ